MPDESLLDIWIADVAALSPAADAATVRRAGEELLDRWAQPQRRYHTGRHLSEMLTAIDTLSNAVGLDAQDRSIARVAAWWHDAVYDVHAPSGENERASARLTRALLATLGVGPAHIGVVERLILLTIDHGTGVPGQLGDVFTDADLAILAAPAARFDAYCAQVREEYAHVPDAAYGAARREILTALVDRPEVYRTSYARSRWTCNARANVRREIGRLSARPG